MAQMNLSSFMFHIFSECFAVIFSRIVCMSVRIMAMHLSHLSPKRIGMIRTALPVGCRICLALGWGRKFRLGIFNVAAVVLSLGCLEHDKQFLEIMNPQLRPKTSYEAMRQILVVGRKWSFGPLLQEPFSENC